MNDSYGRNSDWSGLYKRQEHPPAQIDGTRRSSLPGNVEDSLESTVSRLTQLSSPSSSGDGLVHKQNKYCSNCLCTQPFLDLIEYLLCVRCSKKLDRIDPPPPPLPEITARKAI